MSYLYFRWLDVFPTCVGMNRPSETESPIDFRVPHMRGDEPLALD